MSQQTTPGTLARSTPLSHNNSRTQENSKEFLSVGRGGSYLQAGVAILALWKKVVIYCQGFQRT